MKCKRCCTMGLLFFSAIVQASNAMPYAGQQQRSIKALSMSEVDGLLQGRGMGMAKPAELNHYPGPLHVLELKDSIGLTQQQQRQTKALFDVMKSAAMRIGQQIVDEEQKLDHMFAQGDIDDARLKNSLQRIAVLRGELRFVHLRTHLRQKAIMTPAQIKRYDNIRGYMQHHGKHGHKH